MEAFYGLLDLLELVLGWELVAVTVQHPRRPHLTHPFLESLLINFISDRHLQRVWVTPQQLLSEQLLLLRHSALQWVKPVPWRPACAGLVTESIGPVRQLGFRSQVALRLMVLRLQMFRRAGDGPALPGSLLDTAGGRSLGSFSLGVGGHGGLLAVRLLISIFSALCRWDSERES